MVNVGPSVSIDDVIVAQRRIAGAVAVTPATVSRTLSAITGADVVVKFENLQYTGSFKERGALNRLLVLSDDERARGVVSMSAGNHAQGVAHHAHRLGIAATLVMPIGTPTVKVMRTRELGAEVVLAGDDLAGAHEHARQLVAERELVFVPPYDCPVVMAGQGTLALELLEQHPDLDVIIVPVGGGGLLAGCLVASRAVAPHVEVVGVQVKGHTAFTDLLEHRDVHDPRTETIAEGIAVQRPSPSAVRLARQFRTSVVVVDDDAVEQAVALYLEVEKVVAEGAGAAPLAALLCEPDRFRGRRVGLVLSGGNIDLRILASALLRALARTGRLTTLTVTLADRPGSLHDVTGVLAAHGANVVELWHDRLKLGARLRSATVDIQVETADRQHSDTVVDALVRAGFDVVRHE